MAGNLREHMDNAAHLFASGRLEEALAEYQLVAAAAPEDLASRQKVAELLQRLNRKQEAIETYAVVADGWARQGGCSSPSSRSWARSPSWRCWRGWS